MNRRPLKRSEKILLVLCGAVIGFLSLAFWLRSHGQRVKAAEARIAELEPQLAVVEASLSDAPFWEARGEWLEKTIPQLGDPGEAHARFLEELRTAALDRGLTMKAPVLLKPENVGQYRRLPVTLTLSGPDSAVYRWLIGLQSPEKFQTISYLLLTPQRTPAQQRMECTVTVGRLYRP